MGSRVIWSECIGNFREDSCAFGDERLTLLRAAAERKNIGLGEYHLLVRVPVAVGRCL